MKKIIGVGCDIIEIARIKEALLKNKDAFMTKVLTEQEIDYCQKHKDPGPSIAARFAAKEAISKALGCGIGKELKWHDINICHDKKKKPFVELSAQAKKHFKDVKLEISLSHTHEIAMAFVVAYV